MKRFALTILLLYCVACATQGQARRIEEKLDQLVQATRRETLTEIFGTQSQEITQKIDELESSDRKNLDVMLSEYQRGQSSLEEVRTNVVSVLGGTTRVVSSGRGIWVRDELGAKLRPIGRKTKIEKAQRLSPEELPDAISNSTRLSRYTWGRGEVDGETVVFPWELTLSSFALEIVENTAQRTAQELLRLSDEKGWRRPVTIKVVTESPEGVSITHPGVEDVFVEPGEVKSK